MGLDLKSAMQGLLPILTDEERASLLAKARTPEGWEAMSKESAEFPWEGQVERDKKMIDLRDREAARKPLPPKRKMASDSDIAAFKRLIGRK